jgi:multiple sugar transport system permease protein
VTILIDKAETPRRLRPDRPGVLRKVWEHRADYAYVLPAIAVMLIVIAYPIYYTIELSFYNTPPGLQLRDKIFVGFANYTSILTSPVFWTVTKNTLDLDDRIDVHLLRIGICLRPRAPS